MTPEKKECQDEWHLSWIELVAKYGSDEEADEHHNYARTCPSCGMKRIYGD